MRRDWGGVAMGIAIMAMAVWTFLETPDSRRWTATAMACLGGWFAWRQARDRLDRTVLDIRSAPDGAIEAPDEAFVVALAEADCCFCGKLVGRSDIDPYQLVVFSYGDTARGSWQALTCHAACFTWRVVRPDDEPNRFRPEWM